MSADIFNLNKVRKAKQRVADQKRAEENRAKFGRTTDQKIKDREATRRRDDLLDGARRETPGTEDPDLDPGTVS